MGRSLLTEQAENHYSGSLVDNVGNRSMVRRSFLKNSEVGENIRRTVNDLKSTDKMPSSSLKDKSPITGMDLYDSNQNGRQT